MPAEYPHPSADSDGVPAAAADDVIVSRWNDFSLTEELIRRHAPDLAAVICEPMQRCLVAAPGFLRMLREVTSQCGVLLIFDEMVTGFRFALGGAQERYGIVPDLATFGKALTNGMPMTGIAGSREIIGVSHPNRSPSEARAYFGNTLNGNPLCAAAGVATLDVLGRPGVYERLESSTGKLKRGVAQIAARLGVGVQILGDGPVFLLGCAARGVLSSGKFYLSLAHSDSDISETLDVIAEVLADIES